MAGNPLGGAMAHGLGQKLAIFNTLAPLTPTFQNTTSLQTAIKGNTVGVGYAGAGFLLFYYVGVSKVLQQIGVIKPGHTKTAGASAGILSAAVDYGIVSHDDFIKMGKEFAANCRKNHNCAGTLGEEVRRMTEKMMPWDAAKRISGIGYIALSSPNYAGFPVGDYVVNYTSRQDVINAVYTGVYVPMWSGPTITTTFRGQKRYDGAFRTPMPCPLGNTTYCIKVSVLPCGWTFSEVMKDVYDPKNDPYVYDWLYTTFGTDPKEIAKFMLQAIGTRIVYSGQSVAEMIAGWYAFFSHQPKDGIDIYPGKYNKNPYSLLRWMLMILAPPTDDMIDEMVKMGEKDARSWAQEMGLIPKNAPQKGAAPGGAHAAGKPAPPAAAAKPAAGGKPAGTQAQANPTQAKVTLGGPAAAGAPKWPTWQLFAKPSSARGAAPAPGNPVLSLLQAPRPAAAAAAAPAGGERYAPGITRTTVPIVSKVASLVQKPVTFNITSLLG